MSPKRIVGALDLGTTSTRFFLYDQDGVVISSHGEGYHTKHPNPGWAEQDPIEILGTVKKCMEVAVEKAAQADRSFSPSDVVTIGVTNQRESTVVWDKETGKPLYNSLVWFDTRTSEICSQLETEKGSKDHFRHLTGLPISTYFSAFKLKWLIQTQEDIKKAMEERTCLAGTLDSWLIWNLTGGEHHATDVTNASRTFLFNIHTCRWDDGLCEQFGVPKQVLAKVKACADDYGTVSQTFGPLPGVPINGCVGDQQAALIGQRCFSPGQAKTTYGTGCFLLFNTGEKAVNSKNGLLTTVAYQMSPNEKPCYALEGAVASAGSAFTWLEKGLGLISSPSEIEKLASQVADTGGMYFVPALNGLLAPYWRPDARAVAVGMSSYTTKAHFLRAALEGVAFQAHEVLEAMHVDAGLELQLVKVDGGMTVNDLFMQIQADIGGVPIVRPDHLETTSAGAAFTAMVGSGMIEFKAFSDEGGKTSYTTFEPKTSPEARKASLKGWKNAVQLAIPPKSDR